MDVQNLSRQMLEDLKPGQTLVCNLPDYRAVLSGQVTVSHMRKIMGCNFTCSSSENQLSITRDL